MCRSDRKYSATHTWRTALSGSWKLPFRRESRGVKRKNDYYYIIKLGIFQRKSEETCHHFPNGTLLPGEMPLSENVIQTLSLLCNLPKMLWGCWQKKKKVLWFLCKMPRWNRKNGKPVERLRRKAKGPGIWQPAALSQPYRTWASPQGAVDSQSTKRRALYQPFGRCGALFALCGHGYILGD